MASDTVKIRRGTLKKPTYKRLSKRMLPKLFVEGEGAIYPALRDDLLTDQRRVVTYKTVVMENRHLRVTVVPALGGKLFSLYDKNAKRESLYVPDAIKPGLISLRGAWVPGGMEFNFPIGHHVDTMQNLPCMIVKKGGSEGALRVKRCCPRTGMTIAWTLALRADEARVHIRYTIANPTALTHRWYFWNNVGVAISDQWQFLAKGHACTTGFCVYPFPNDVYGRDISWIRNRRASCDCFMAGYREDFFGCYDGAVEHGLAEVAPWQSMPGRKYFAWGEPYSDFDDRRWLSDNHQSYAEIQTGPTESQRQFELLAPGESKTFGETWIPFAKLGGLEWASDAVLLNVRDNTLRVFAARPSVAMLKVGKKTWTKALQPGKPVDTKLRVRKGAVIHVEVDGKSAREFAYPFVGRKEPGLMKRAKSEPFITPLPTTGSFDNLLARARWAVRLGHLRDAAGLYAQAMAKKKTPHEARLEYADVLWHLAEFAKGAKECRALFGSQWDARARAMLSRRADVEAAFNAPVEKAKGALAREIALAEQYAGYHSWEKAGRLFNRLARKAPKNPRIAYGQALYAWRVKRDPKAATRHALRALELSKGKPNFRDYFLEMLNVLRFAGRHDLIVEWIAKAPVRIAKLPIAQRVLAHAHLEREEFDFCLKTLRASRMNQGEGDQTQYDWYVDAHLAKAEALLDAGKIAKAEAQIAKCATPPPNVGSGLWYLAYARVVYWQGECRYRAGDIQGARKIWREALEKANDIETERVLVRSDRLWNSDTTPEERYMCVLCAWRLGRKAEVKRLLPQIRNDWWIFLTPSPDVSDLFDGLQFELAGQWKQAAASFTKALRHTTHPMLIRRHLAAVKAGRRRGCAE